jgi:Fe-S-cluster-containing hydrogenase component 2
MNDVVSERGAVGRDPAMLSPALQRGYAQLRRLPIFDGIPNEELAAAMGTGGIKRMTLRRDSFVADSATVAAGNAPIVFVAEGQIAAAVFDEDHLMERRAAQQRWEQMTEEERKEQSALEPPPLARVARKNLAVFMPGDLFNAAALSAGGVRSVAFYTVGPTVAATIEHATIADLAVRYPFFEARFRRAVTLSKQRLRNIFGVKQEILDFFVRHGISVSGEMVRVRQLDRCIDCKLCEEACEERYGSKRLTLGGYQLGMLDFIYTCRTCTDQRCIDPCDFDSIKYDEARGEVVINEATCTGCTLCAQSCPYHAIEMVDISDPQSPTYREEFRLRLDAEGKLEFGPGRGRVARARRIANKCDHCMNYGDQACVSACPTGSLIEISAYDLFHERSSVQAALARSGYDQEAGRDRKEILPTEPFTKGVGIKDAGLAKVRRGRFWPVIFWGLGLAAWFLATIEIMLRIYAPTNSLQYFTLRQDPEMTPEMAVLKVGYRAGTELAVWCGYFGAGLMLIAAIYPMMRRIKAFRWLASNTMWFDFHMMAGTIGPLFILQHSALKLDNWVSAAFWSMVIVVVSGVIGRYLYTQVPDLLNGRELEELEHQRAFARLRGEYGFAAAEVEAELTSHREKAERIAEHAGLTRTLFWIIMEDLRRPSRWLRRRRRLAGTSAPRKVRRELARRAGRMMLIDRRRVLVPRAQLLLHSWKKVHVPFTLIMVAISAVHIWVAFQYSM